MKLQEQLGLPVDGEKAMIGIISRLVDQKGFDLVAHVMDELCQDDIQLVVLGTGEEQYENMFRHFDWKYSDKVSANIYYSEELSHRIYASCHEENIGSKRVMQKAGMTYEGKLRDGQKNLDGSYSNLDLYSILENEFIKK